MGDNYILEIRNCRKEFPGVVALDNVCFNLKRGEIHALVGENGAGKSTIMKILAGIHSMDAGEIIFEGKKFEPRTPSEALEIGISMVHQELDLIPEMTVEENVFAGRERTHGLIVDRNWMVQKTKQLIDELGVDIDPKAKISQLSTAQQQMVAIIRAIAFNSKVIIMDEPTSAITDREVEKLFEIIRKLKSQDKSIVYISHKMDEIFALTDRITVLRDGKLIGTVQTKDVTSDQLINMMVGRDLTDMYVKSAPRAADYEENEILLSVRDLTVNGVFQNISFDVKRGEILGIYGLMGAGRTEIMETIFGIRKPDNGTVTVNGKHIKSVKDSVNNGLAFITEDRKIYGLNLIASIKDNISMVYLKSMLKGKFLIDFKKECEVADELIEKLRIKCNSRDTIVGTLSGGNQQKVAIAKWFLGNPDVLIMDEPTRGIDIGAKAEVYKLIDSLAKSGKGIIMISSEVPELLGMSDRVIIIHEGEITGEFIRDEIDQDTLMACAIGERR